jgi:hypothetical protein
MHDAPPVSHPAGRCRLAAVLGAACWAAGLLAVGAWTWLADAPNWRHALGLLAVAATGLAAWAGWRRSPRGLLAWDGAGCWTWAEAGVAGPQGPQPGRIERLLDLQSHLLLRWQAEGSTAARWLWLQQGGVPADWAALRRAVYSRATSAAPQAPAKP